MDKNINTNTNENGRPDVIFAVMKIMRSMRRRPPKPGEGLHPGLARPLEILANNDGVTSRELAELLDIRPSSLTELLGKLETEGFVSRSADESDRRVSRVSLTDKGKELAAKLNAEHEQRKARASACFTDEETAQFCALCERLSQHLQSLAKEDGEDGEHMPHHPHLHDFRRGPCAGFPGESFGGQMFRYPPRHRKLR